MEAQPSKPLLADTHSSENEHSCFKESAPAVKVSQMKQLACHTTQPVLSCRFQRWSINMKAQVEVRRPTAIVSSSRETKTKIHGSFMTGTLPTITS